MSENSKNQEKARTIFLNPWGVFGFEIFLFSIALALGISAGLRLNRSFEIQEISLPSFSLWQFLVYFTLGTAFFLLVSYFLKLKQKKEIFFRTFFILAIFVANVFFFSLWFPTIPCFILSFSLVYILLKRHTVFLHNLVLIMVFAGAGAGLGLNFQPKMLAMLLFIFSIYDWVAVYKTKHMVKMAKEMVESKAILGFIIPQKIADFKSEVKETEVGGRFLILGGGDIVFPLMFAVSLIPQGILKSLIVALFSLIGLFVGFLIFINQKTKRPMPALPPIALFSIIGYFLTTII